tara:strand:+ start:142 stop:258 length:117 start_codon:yes stop_codon:yes gene_type:complete
MICYKNKSTIRFEKGLAFAEPFLFLEMLHHALAWPGLR